MRRALLLLAAAGALSAGSLSGQGSVPRYSSEPVRYQNPNDSTVLTGSLFLPPGRGPFGGVVLMSIAGTDPIVERLTELSFAVLVPIRRGFVSVEPLLQSTYQELADDGAAAVAYLRARPDVADERVTLIGQNDDAPPAIMAAAQSPTPIPLVLLAPPGFIGRELFRLEQHGLAERRGVSARELDVLDLYVDAISAIILKEVSPYMRAYRMEEMMAETEVELPYNAAFPDDEGRIHFFSAPLWYDRISFDPAKALAQLHGPVLLLIGQEDPDTPLDRYLPTVQGALAIAPTKDATVCVVLERTRHSFNEVTVGVIGTWVRDRDAGRATAVSGCLREPEEKR
ncbi:MAG: hypothetical protein EXR95_03020 [Gemmatimonadetes bacterium]|nr:hypothetical protein [Gemmatimonadota bacterium]